MATAEISVACKANLCNDRSEKVQYMKPETQDEIDADALTWPVTDKKVKASNCSTSTAIGAADCVASSCSCGAGGGTSGCGCLQPWTSICKTGCGNSCCSNTGFGGLFGNRTSAECCSSGACGSCASGGSCRGDCLCCCDSWSFIGEMLFLTRTSADNLALITDQNTGGELLNAQDFDFDYNAAPRLFIRHQNSRCNGFDIGYMGIDSWNDMKFRGDPVSPTLIGPGGFPFPSAGPGGVFNAAYGSEFHSAEFNFRRRCNECTTWVAGARMVDFSDTLIATSVAPTAADFFTIDADNHMYGFQIGFDTEVINCGGQFHVDTILRAGLMFNDADQTTNVPILSGAPAGVVATNVSADDDHTAFLGELGVRTMYELNDSVSVGGGYHLIWLEGVALAPDQIPVTSLIGTGNAALDTGGSLLFHGAVLSLIVSY
jgi:hypothetical protein